MGKIDIYFGLKAPYPCARASLYCIILFKGKYNYTYILYIFLNYYNVHLDFSFSFILLL